MHMIHELIVSILLVAGGAFALVGSWGLIRLPDLMSRLHAPTKATTAGVGGALVGSMVYFLTLKGSFSLHELLITLFLFLTAPITAHFLAKAFMHRHPDLAKKIPPPDTEHGWSTFAVATGTEPRERQASRPRRQG